MSGLEAPTATPPDPGAKEPPQGPAGATRADVVGTLAIIAVATLIAAWDPIVRRASAHPSEEECAALLDRYVEHVAYAVDPSPKSSGVADRRAAAKSAAKNRSAFARCESDLTHRELDCAMKAPSADDFERCLPQGGSQ